MTHVTSHLEQLLELRLITGQILLAHLDGHQLYNNLFLVFIIYQFGFQNTHENIIVYYTCTYLKVIQEDPDSILDNTLCLFL